MPVTTWLAISYAGLKHPDEFVAMVLVGAPSHRASILHVPNNMNLLRFPPYSPELNPAERLREELREKDSANRVVDSLGVAMTQAVRGLRRLEQSGPALDSLTGWQWALYSFGTQLGMRLSGRDALPRQTAGHYLNCLALCSAQAQQFA